MKIVNLRSAFMIGAVLVAAAGAPAHAQGIMVQNPQNYTEMISEWSSRLTYLKSQLDNETNTLKSLTGNLNPGSLAPGMLNQLRNVLPSNWQNVYNDAMGSGSSLAGSAQQINSAFGNQIAGMDHLQALQYSMNQMQSQGGYDRAMAQQAYNGIQQTYSNLQEISDQMNSVQTEKDAVDLQNRLQAAQGQIQTQNAQLQLMTMLQNAQTKLMQMQHQKAESNYAFGDLDNIDTPDFTSIGN